MGGTCLVLEGVPGPRGAPGSGGSVSGPGGGNWSWGVYLVPGECTWSGGVGVPGPRGVPGQKRTVFARKVNFMISLIVYIMQPSHNKDWHPTSMSF